MIVIYTVHDDTLFEHVIISFMIIIVIASSPLSVEMKNFEVKRASKRKRS